MRACVRACVRACMHVCVCVCVCDECCSYELKHTFLILKKKSSLYLIMDDNLRDQNVFKC